MYQGVYTGMTKIIRFDPGTREYMLYPTKHIAG